MDAGRAGGAGQAPEAVPTPSRRRLGWAGAAAALMAVATASALVVAGGASAAPARSRGAAGGASAGKGSEHPAAARHGAQLASSTGPAHVTVTGTGTVSGAPDTLTLQIGVSTRAPSATAALDEADTELASLQAVFETAGVPSGGLQTSGLDLQPNEDSSGAITGYEADEELTVTMHDLARAGTVIDDAAHQVGNDVRLDGVSFSIADTTALLARARAAAFADAHAAALALAAAAGQPLGPLVSVTDQTQQQAPPPGPYFSAAGTASRAAAPVPLNAGTQQVTAQVELVYDLGS